MWWSRPARAPTRSWKPCTSSSTPDSASITPRSRSRPSQPLSSRSPRRRADVLRSEGRILTTHVGSLPRPPALRDLLVRQDRGEAVDAAALERDVSPAPSPPVPRQLHAGLDAAHRPTHHGSHEPSGLGLRRQMRKGPELSRAGGLLLQVDGPDLGRERPRFFRRDALEASLEMVELHVEAINRATAAIPPERIRLHL